MVNVILLLSLLLTSGDGVMKKQRTDPWGAERRGKAVDGGRHVHGKAKSTKLTKRQKTALRAKYHKDFLAFYREVWCAGMVDRRTGVNPADNLGKIHLLLIDFLNLNRSDVVRYTDLHKHLPKKNGDGEFVHERWLYWPVLDGPPVVEDVTVNEDGEHSFGPLQKMFKEQFWHGMLLVVRSDGRFKTVLIPRGFLKSSICTEAFTGWLVVREPDARHFMRSLTGSLAINFTSIIKWQFEANDKFRDLYAHMGPPAKREGVWSTQGLQVNQAGPGEEPKWRSRGKEWTIEAYGMESEVTGRHCDVGHLDDIVGATNAKTPAQRAKGCESLEQMQAIPDPDAEMNNIGTRWEVDDAHGSTLDRKRSDLANYCSFLIATCVDGDKKAVCPKKISPLGYGKPLWPFFNMRSLQKKRAGCRDDRFWFGQYFQQFTGTALRTFSTGWLKERYLNSSEECAKTNKLSIYVFFDTASGKHEQKGKLDYTACMVIGQSQDRRRFYLLDGFREKLPASLIAKAMVKVTQRWRDIAYGYSGSLWAGVEENAYTQFLDPLLTHEMRQAGMDRAVTIRGVPHNKESKYERIRAMAQGFSEFRWYLPERIDVKPMSDSDEPYDLVAVFLDEFENWPGVPNDDCLDALAGAHHQTLPIEHDVEHTVQNVITAPYRRDDVVKDTEGLHGYEDDSAPWRSGVDDDA